MNKIEQVLLKRSGAKCELCSSQGGLVAYEVQPKPKDNSDTYIMTCKICIEQLAKPESMDVNHWRALGENMWSEVKAVQVMSYRILKLLGSDTWVQDQLSQLYLDDEAKEWAESGLQKDNKDDRDPTLDNTLDSNGTALADGDSVTLIKDLVVKGANFTAKRGTMVKGISLTDDPKHIEGRVNGTRIVLVAAYLKKA